ncbi:MAG: hypothetical protein QOG63_553, partial [Thermoleophilaceae bacterium]|nr:hypothetical protein [Thermoleophilaceae bacterium]
MGAVRGRRPQAAGRRAEIVFWGSSLAVFWTHLGYPAALWLLARKKNRPLPPCPRAPLPSVSLIIAAYNEASVIARKIANARALDYPADRLEVIVSVNASTDGTADAARAAGADVVIDRPEQGKVRAQDAAVERAKGEILFFSDANSTLAPDSLRRLIEPFA